MSTLKKIIGKGKILLYGNENHYHPDSTELSYEEFAVKSDRLKGIGERLMLIERSAIKIETSKGPRTHGFYPGIIVIYRGSYEDQLHVGISDQGLIAGKTRESGVIIETDDLALFYKEVLSFLKKKKETYKESHKGMDEENPESSKWEVIRSK